ncbi:MAG: superoxide dismutase [Candidatus Cloacimonas acidaminovorans]|nr:superoxide dismutase [Candidatus Cloacimonas acidaminovorans]
MNLLISFLLTIQTSVTMLFTLPALPYTAEALAPTMSQETLNFHHGKHHLAYVNNLNNLAKGTRYETMDLEAIVRESDGAIFNNAAQVWNHTFFFEQFKTTGCEAEGDVRTAIEKKWGSFDAFKTEFNNAGATLFGSGWVWLVKDANGNLEIVKESNAGNPLTKGLKPLLTFDVWEHAYYLDYQNRRADYLNALWNIIDWKVIESRW